MKGNLAMSFLPELPPIHPGRIFRKYVLREKNLTVAEAADRMEVRAPFLQDFVNEKITVDMELARKLHYFTGCTTEYWINLQTNFDRALSAGKGHRPPSR
jgi:addiction module HigA family antidote